MLRSIDEGLRVYIAGAQGLRVSSFYALVQLYSVVSRNHRKAIRPSTTRARVPHMVGN